MNLEIFDIWVKIEKKAKETGDYKEYKWFLKEFLKEFNKLYMDLKDIRYQEIVGKYIELASCKLKKISIKYKK